MYDEYLDSHQKDFATECLQIKYWDQCLGYIYAQISILDQLSKSEEERSNDKGNYIGQLSNEYYVSCQKVSGEPSNIFYLTQIILDLYIKQITISRRELSKLNAELSNSIQDILNGISYIREKIIQLSHKTMTEVTQLMHNSTATQAKFTKLKQSLDEAQANKKRLEQNPKFAYNVTMKAQAEQRVLDKVQEMEALMPEMKSLSKALEDKRNEFNMIMKDNFEIVFLNSFKHLAHLHQFFFLIAKTRLDVSIESKEVIHDSFNLITQFTVNINDFTEKKFAALHGITYDSIEMINLQDQLTKSNVTQLLNASHSVINYVHTFYICLKMRRTLMKRSLKYFNQYKTYEKQSKSDFDRKEKKFSDDINDLSIIGNGTANSWKILFDSFDILDISQEKTVIMNEISDYILQSKKDYSDMKTKWSKIESKLIQKRSEIEEIEVVQRKKLQQQGKNNKEIEEKVSKKIKGKTPRFIEVINYAIEFIQGYLGCLREKDIKRCTMMIEKFSATLKNAEELYERRLELFQSEIDHCTQVDLFEECELIFKQYFIKFNITNYTSFLEKIKMKILIKSDFHKGKLGQNAMSKMNEMNMSMVMHNNTTYQLKSMIKTKKASNANKLLNEEELNSLFNKEIEEEFEFKPENCIFSSDDGRTNKNVQGGEANSPQSEEKKSTHPSQICFIERDDKKILPLYHKKEKSSVAQANEASSKKNSSKENGVSNSLTYNNTFLNMEDEKIDFVNKQNFAIVDHQSPYQNFKGQEIEEYKNRLEDKPLLQSQKDAFELEEGEHIQNNFYCAYSSGILLQGRLYVTNKKLVFDSMFNSSTVIGKRGAKLFIPLKDITKIAKTTHLLIFDNSIEIHTSKTVLFFTSFFNRDQCAQLISKSINSLPPEERLKEGEVHSSGIDEDAQLLPNEKLKLTKYPKLKLKRIRGIAAMLKEIDFFNRLDKIHNERLEQFNSFTKDEFYLPHSEFKATYYDEVITLAPPVIISNFIFNPNTLVDEFNHSKSFFESIFLDRRDTDVQLTIDSKNNDIPLFYSDLDYNMSLFGNFDRKELDDFLNDIAKWPQVLKYRIQVLHPIKKYFIGPEKVNLDDHYYVYYVSPKCFVVDDCSYGIGFPFSDTFVSITQYRFNTSYAFNERKGKFQFETHFTVSFLIKFTKSCIFAGKIADSGYETACEGIKGYTYDKIKLVVDNQALIFNEMLNKLSEDRIQKKVICEREENDDEDEDDNVQAENNNVNEGKEVQIQSQVIQYELDSIKKQRRFSAKQWYLLMGVIGIILLYGLKYYYSDDPNKANYIFSLIRKLINYSKALKWLFTIDNAFNIGIIIIVIWLVMNMK